MYSNTKSNSIRKIETHYGINMSSIKTWMMDKLTSSFNGTPTINGFKDLMLGDHLFDLSNMTESELTNLRYLTLSTKEVIEVANRKIKCVYYKPKFARLRMLMSYDDFYQICMDKLMLNNGILKFDANYKLECALQYWFERVAMWKSKHRANVADEVAILDKPCSDDNGTTIGDLILKDEVEEFNELDADVEYRLNHILSNMDKSVNNRIVLKAGNTSIPLSEYNLAKLFITHSFGKKELSKMMINTTNNKPVSNQIFNKFYKQMIADVASQISQEYSDLGEVFKINIDEF